MYRRHYRNFRFIGILFWVLPYILWQSFGHFSGLFIGLLLSILLTLMLNGLFRQGNQSNWNMSQQPVRINQQPPRYQEEYQWDPEPYQSGYRAQSDPYREEQPHQVSEVQPPHEEMQVEYPEMPPMEQH
jgi:hypothetical protein